MKMPLSTMKTSLLSGIAGLSIAAAVSFAAQAQTDATAPSDQSTAQTSEMMPSGDTDRPVAKHTSRHNRHSARSGPHDSTPAEQAATERLNEQQLSGNTRSAVPGAGS